MLSIDTNTGQLAALDLLQGASAKLQEIQTQIASGEKVRSPKDNGATFAIAQNARALAASYGVLDQARSRTLDLLNTSETATQSISDLLIEMKKLAVEAADSSITSSDRAALDQQFQALKSEIDNISGSASFGNQNLVGDDSSQFVQMVTNMTWGVPPRTYGQPNAGEQLDLHLTFSRQGADEPLDGTVNYALRYFDTATNSWHVVSLASYQMPTSPPIDLTASSPTFDAQESVAMPTLPPTAASVQIYAEYDRAHQQDTLANGAPGGDAATGRPLLMASWTPPVLSEAQPQPSDIASDTGPALNGQSVSTGATVSSSVRFDYPGISPASQYTISDEASDPANGTTAIDAETSTSSNIAYSWTLQPPANVNQNYTNEAIVASQTVVYPPVAAVTTGTTLSQNSATTASNLELNGQPITSADDAAVATNLPAAFATQAPVGVRIDMPSDEASEAYVSQASLDISWIDPGNPSVLNQTTLATVQQTHAAGDPTAPSAITLQGNLPSSINPAYANVSVHVQVTHDPGPDQTVETYDVPLISFENTQVVSDQMTLADAPITTIVYNTVRQTEYTSQTDALNTVEGGSTIVRDQNVSTAGVNGLYLENASLASQSSAQDAIDYVDGAQQIVSNLSEYYGVRAQQFSDLQTFDNDLTGTINTNIGRLIDADMAAEAARLQAATTQQKLAAQALAIANTFPQVLLTLFAH